MVLERQLAFIEKIPLEEHFDKQIQIFNSLVLIMLIFEIKIFIQSI